MEEARSCIGSALIIGGGLAGLSAAISLNSAGIRVQLIDIEPEWTVLGAGLTLNGASLRALDALGVLDAVKEAGSFNNTQVCAYDRHGKVLFQFPRPQDPQARVPPSGGILRSTLHKILIDRAVEVGVETRLGVTWTDIQPSGAKAVVALSDGAAGEFDLVIAADGFKSKLRRTFFPHAPAPEFVGQGCWRAIFERPKGFGGALFIGEQVKAGLNPISGDRMYLYLLQSVPDNRHMPEDRWVVLLQEQLEEFSGMLAELRENLSAKAHVNYRPLECLVVPSPWYRGRLLLIGDAAHATTPHLAHGAGMGFEDALVIKEALASSATIEAALEKFMKRRFQRCQSIVAASIKMSQLETSHSAPQEQARHMTESTRLIMEPI